MFRSICLVVTAVLTVEDGETVLVRDLTHLWRIVDVIQTLSGAVLPAQ